MQPEQVQYEPYGVEDQYVEAPQGGYMPPGMVGGGMVPMPGQNSQFLQWLFNFKKEVTVPLRYLWRGYEQDETGQWRKKGNKPLMNEAGITWAISLIESYINPVYIVSNYSEEDMNWTMRQLGRVVYNNLCAKYKEFGLDRLNIQRVGNEIVSKVHAILLGALNNGYRMFFSSTHSTQEISNTTPNTQKQGVLPNLKNLFFRN